MFMRKKLFISLALLLVTHLQGQVFKQVDTTKYVGYSAKQHFDTNLMKRADGFRSLRAEEGKLPEVVNNAKARWFPPIFTQMGGSCGASSRIGYMMTYEWNAFNQTDASLLENQLPPHFEYPFTYNGPSKDQMAISVGYPSGKCFGGSHTSDIYGFSEWKSDDFAWMQGYENWYNAMFHRISRTANFPESSLTESGAKAIKRWLFNHNGDSNWPTITDENGTHIVGGVAGLGCGISGSQLASIAKTEANEKAGVVGLQYMKHWRIGTADHAITLVGYDDRIEFDLDANGVYGEKSNYLKMNETGAWICANSWGASWGDKGLFYVPYALAGGLSQEVKYTPEGSSQEVTVYRSNGGWWPEVYYLKTNYRPLRTMKIKMTYSKRSEISVSVGATQDLSSEQPSVREVFPYINYTGDGIADNRDAETPLLGKWADNKMHHEAMEFGIDLTSLTEKFDMSKPIKYFLMIDTKRSANGKGEIEFASVIDYTFNKLGIEMPAEKKNVSIQTKGKQTIISIVVQGEALNAPSNLILDNKTLRWTAPLGTAYKPSAYIIYKDGEELTTTTETTYALPQNDGVYTIKAQYRLGEELILSSASNQVGGAVLSKEEALDNDVINFKNSGIRVPNVCSEGHSQFTMEFWLKPTARSNWNQQIGNGWGSFLFHLNADGHLTTGWANGANRLDTKANLISTNKWYHIAVVVDGAQMKLYVNGKLEKSLTSSGYSGFPALSKGLEIGFASNRGWAMKGLMDEIRLWDTARSETEIQLNKARPIARPKQMKHLLAYYKMDTIEVDGATLLKDWAGDNHAPFINNNYSVEDDAQKTFGWSKEELSGAILMPKEIYQGVPADVDVQTSEDVQAIEWSCADMTPKQIKSKQATLVFDKLGKTTLTLKLTDINGKVKLINKEIKVLASPKPTADFSLSFASIKGADRISFHALNEAPACRYEWSMPKADITSATTRSASATYSTLGQKTVTLKVTDAQGKVYQVSKTFTVEATAPVLDFDQSKKVIYKGESVSFTDKSKYQPTEWRWILVSDNHYASSKEQNPSFKLDKAGVYKLIFTAKNSEGETSLTAERALVVCASKSHKGLSFRSQSGNAPQTMTTKTINGVDTRWTMDYWFMPNKLESESNGIYGSSDDFSITADVFGAVTLKIGTKRYATPNHYYVKNEWHHYAIQLTYDFVIFYRDGLEFSRRGYRGGFRPSYLSKIRLGGKAQVDGVFDEFRFWTSNVARLDLQELITHELDDKEIKEAREQKGLKVYYQFNQSSGLEVSDASGNNNTALRANVGPDGDAWRDSSGVFALNFTKEDEGANALNRESYRILTCSDEELDKETAPADYILDGDFKTSWHSLYSSKKKYFPHSVTILRANKDVIKGIKISSNRGKNHRAALLTIQESPNGKDWTAVEEDRYLLEKSVQTVSLEKAITEPYFRLIFKNEKAKSNILFINELTFFGEAKALKTKEIPLTYVSCSDEEVDKENGAGANAFDNKEQTLWHSRYSSNTKAYAHSITFENKTQEAIALLNIKQRKGKNYSAGKMNIRVSQDGKNFKLFAQDVRLPYHANASVCLTQATDAKYIQLEFLHNQEHKGDFLAIKEIKAYSYEGQAKTPVQAVEQEALRCYPNPATDYVVVEGLRLGERLALYNLSGVLVQRFTADESNTLTLDLQALPKGIYILRAGQKSFKLELH